MAIYQLVNGQSGLYVSENCHAQRNGGRNGNTNVPSENGEKEVHHVISEKVFWGKMFTLTTYLITTVHQCGMRGFPGSWETSPVCDAWELSYHAVRE